MGQNPPLNINQRRLRAPMDGRWLRLSARALCFSGGFVIDYLWLAYGVGFGRFVRLQFLPTLSLVRARVSYGRPAWGRFRSIATPPFAGGLNG